MEQEIRSIPDLFLPDDLGDPTGAAFGEIEQPLAGGNVNAGVVRIGDTVRRPAGPHTPAVHALLDHLHEVGFRYAPRPSGIDEQGREVLTYLPGVSVHPHRTELLDADRSLIEIGRLIREFHDASAGFVPPVDAQWQVLIPDVGADLIVHHDLAPWNIVAGPAGGWGLIDWDVAAPGTRLWDLAYAAHGFVPLTADPTEARPDPARRLRVLVDAYGLDEDDRRRLVELLAARTRSMYDLLAHGAATATEPWATLWREGHGQTWAGNTEYIDANTATWRAALLDEQDIGEAGDGRTHTVGSGERAENGDDAIKRRVVDHAVDAVQQAGPADLAAVGHPRALHDRPGSLVLDLGDGDDLVHVEDVDDEAPGGPAHLGGVPAAPQLLTDSPAHLPCRPPRTSATEGPPRPPRAPDSRS